MQQPPNQGGYPPYGGQPWPQQPAPGQNPSWQTPDASAQWQQPQPGQDPQWQAWQGAPQPQQPDPYWGQPPQIQQPPMPELKTPGAPQKRRGGAGKLIKALLALAVAGGVAWYFLGNLTGGTGMSTAVVESSVLGSNYTGDALVVRNETAFDEEGVQSIDYVAQEGSVVYRGDVICYVYSTGYSTSEMNALQDYRDQIKEYQQTLLLSETAYDQRMTRLENEVIERGLEVRSLVQGARGNMDNQETILETAITERQNYFRSKYSSDSRLSRLYDDEATQQRRIDGWINQEIATQESIVSFYTDGFEYALSPSTYETYTPAQVRNMINGQIPQTTSAARGRIDLYRLVKQNNYAVLMLVDDNNWNPVEGNTYKLVLEQFTSTVVDAQVLSYTRSGGELLLRLAVMGDVKDVLYMRSCRAQLGEYVDCMSVPEGALYERDGAQCVAVVNTDGQQYLVPVNVLRREGGLAYITAVQTGYLTAGQTVRLFR